MEKIKEQYLSLSMISPHFIHFLSMDIPVKRLVGVPKKVGFFGHKKGFKKKDLILCQKKKIEKKAMKNMKKKKKKMKKMMKKKRS